MIVDLIVNVYSAIHHSAEVVRFDGQLAHTRVYHNISRASYKRLAAITYKMQKEGRGHFSPWFTVFGWRYTNYTNEADNDHQ